MAKVVLALVLLSLADGFATLWWLSQGQATEANPFMHWVLTYLGAAPFIYIKTVGVGMLGWVLASVGAKRSLWALCAVYALLMVWHLQGLRY